MAWMCTGCSSQHEDRLATLGFGLCKSCADIAKKKRAERKASLFAQRRAYHK